jgi:hypothetical protein
MTQLRVVGVLAALVVVSLSFSAQAAEKKKVMGTDKYGPTISRTVVSPEDDPKHELTMNIRRDTTTSSDPDFNGTEIMIYGQNDQVAGTGGTHRGYNRRSFKNGDILFGSFEGSTRAQGRKRRGRGPGSRLEEPASLRMAKALARIGGRPRQKVPLASGKVKWNTN